MVERGAFTMVANFASEPRRVPLPHLGELVLTSSDGVALDTLSIALPPDGSAILKMR